MLSFLSTFHFAKLHFTIGFLYERIAFNFLGIVLGSEPSHLLLISEGFAPNALLICNVIQTVISQAAASPVGVPSGKELHPIFSSVMFMGHSSFQIDIYILKLNFTFTYQELSTTTGTWWIKYRTNISTLKWKAYFENAYSWYFGIDKLMIKETCDTFSIRCFSFIIFLLWITGLLIYP